MPVFLFTSKLFLLAFFCLACHGLTGAGFVFYRNPYSGQWTLNQSYPSPAGYQGHFGYAVDIAQNYSVIGAYGFDDLRGSVYLADRAPEEVAVPTMAPSLAATAAPSNPAEVLSGGGLNRRVNKSELTLGMVLALALGVLIIAAATGLICYCCCCMVPIIPLLKKKKKKEEVRYIFFLGSNRLFTHFFEFNNAIL